MQSEMLIRKVVKIRRRRTRGSGKRRMHRSLKQRVPLLRQRMMRMMTMMMSLQELMMRMRKIKVRERMEREMIVTI